ncbi:2OG-Fe(II) oxygenase [Amantichitinum ursilacus]|uniref:2OG-Fe(II) oxygenase superfamily protein n=1 Tax=Amantichitinum ursilacus TaxID=857265 RepID=A0A0N1JTB7_9NEIS|nr:2OG-Fe(II) oxygenase [Amantichitinum ursilacus]KPC53961.1 2OG-Fe(II) oxygenase superfamily protein [Amantichitinum ursilacus]
MTGFNDAVQALVDNGYAVWPGFLTPQQVAALRADIDARRATFHAAGIGRQQGYQRDDSIRGDDVLWLERDDVLAVPVLDQLEAMRQAFNQSLFLGLAEFEAHFAVYPAGSFYKRHLDQHRNADTRVVTFVLYLNDADWAAEDGGQLRMFLHDDAPPLDVTPLGGTLVLFMSDRYEHEVLPARRERRSMTGWFRRAQRP